MTQMIDLRPYLPDPSPRIRPETHERRDDLLLAVEAVVTAVIAVSMMVGITAFLLML